MFFLNKIYTVLRNIFVLIGVFLSVLWLGKMSAKKEEEKNRENENAKNAEKTLTYERKVKRLNNDALNRILHKQDYLYKPLQKRAKNES